MGSKIALFSLCVLLFGCGEVPNQLSAATPTPGQTKSGGPTEVLVECPEDKLQQDVSVQIGPPENGEEAPHTPEEAIEFFFERNLDVKGISGNEFERSPGEAPGDYEVEMVRYEDSLLQARFLIEEAFGGFKVAQASFCPSLIVREAGGETTP